MRFFNCCSALSAYPGTGFIYLRVTTIVLISLAQLVFFTTYLYRTTHCSCPCMIRNVA